MAQFAQNNPELFEVMNHCWSCVPFLTILLFYNVH
jgi:hypothetical protein